MLSPRALVDPSGLKELPNKKTFNHPGRNCENNRLNRPRLFANTIDTNSNGTKDTENKSHADNFGMEQDNLLIARVDDDNFTWKDRAAIGATVTVTVLAFWGLLTASGPGGWRYFLAGGLCATFSHSITTPIDVVKTRQQVDPGLKEKGMIKSTLKIVRKEGPQALLAGLGPTAFGYLMEGAVKFGVYEVLKPAVSRCLISAAEITSIAWINSRILGYIICGTMSGIAAAAILCPMEALRIRLVAEPDFARKGWIHGGVTMLKSEGIVGLFKGMVPMLFKQVPYTVTKNVSFDVFTQFAYAFAKTAGYVMSTKTKLVIPLLCAMLSSILSCVSSHPGDLLLSLVNAHKGNITMKDFAVQTMKKDGIRGFFVGLNARFLHVGIIVTTQLMMYDIIKRLVGIAATGTV